jgi:predicted metal-dependent phosphoesterase TrpH
MLMGLTMVATATNAQAQNTQLLKEVWENLDSHSCPHHYNFHLHTTCSDGQMTPINLMEQAVKIGLKGIAITDHHSTQGYEIAQNFLNTTRKSFPHTHLPHLWTGIEVTSNVLGTDVHILGYGFKPHHPAMIPYLKGTSPEGRQAEAKSVIDALHQAGGLVILAHPFRYRRPASELIPQVAHLGIDGVEAYYAYANPKPWTPDLIKTEQAKHLCGIYGLFTTCGTDSHGTNLLHRI